MKSILLHINDDAGQEARLLVACELARAHQGHVACVQATPYYAFIMGDPLGGMYPMVDLYDKLAKDREAHKSEVSARLMREQIEWDWQACDGDVAQSIINRSHLADVIVLSQEDGDGKASALPLVADVALHTRTPVLAVPLSVERFDCAGPVIVAWNGSPEASYALRAALPMLRTASKVRVVTILEPGGTSTAADATTFLSRHRIHADTQVRVLDSDIGATIEAAATEFGASYVVMGAYGHSRFREALLGGVTRHMLGGISIPLLLAH